MKQDLYEGAEIIPQKDSNNLGKLIDNHNQLNILRKTKIVFPEPIVKLGSINLIYPNTTNLIAGLSGSHKTRFIEHIISGILYGEKDFPILDLSFNKSDRDPYIILLDTERPKEMFAYGIQNIFQHAGYNNNDDLNEKFFHASLIEFDQSDRFEMFEDLLAKVALEHQDKHLIVVLDVIQDFVQNFNDPKECSKLINIINMLRSKFNATIIGITHESLSSKTIKGKGHLGSIMEEKSTLVISMRYEIGSRKIVKLTFRKTSRIGIPEPIYLKFDSDKKHLVLADKIDFENMKQEKAPIHSVVTELFELLKKSDNNISKKNALEFLKNKFDASERTIRGRLKTIEDENLFKNNGYNLLTLKKGKEIHYELY